MKLAGTPWAAANMQASRNSGISSQDIAKIARVDMALLAYYKENNTDPAMGEKLAFGMMRGVVKACPSLLGNSEMQQILKELKTSKY